MKMNVNDQLHVFEVYTYSNEFSQGKMIFSISYGSQQVVRSQMHVKFRIYYISILDMFTEIVNIESFTCNKGRTFAKHKYQLY